MPEAIKALLVEACADSLRALGRALERQSIEVLYAKNCAAAASILWSGSLPHMVFTEPHLADGSWTEVLTAAGNAAEAVNVIVVAPFADVTFYVQTIEQGAFDFVVLPLSDAELHHVVKIAADNAVVRRRKCIQDLPPAARAACSARELAKAPTW